MVPSTQRRRLTLTRRVGQKRLLEARIGEGPGEGSPSVRHAHRRRGPPVDEPVRPEEGVARGGRQRANVLMTIGNDRPDVDFLPRLGGRHRRVGTGVVGIGMPGKNVHAGCI
eukprot:scaffold33420_cov36-Tisochrysis_lutea.AAC.1